MLMDTDLDVTQQEYVRTAQGSGKALVSLINEVLDQAKIESGKLELEAVPFYIRAILDDVLSLFSEKSQGKGVEVIYLSFLLMPFYLVEFSSSAFSNHNSWLFVFDFWGAQLAVYVSDKVPKQLIGDPGRFRQIITNLMGNSIKVSL